MRVSTARLTSKNQITLPADAVRAMNAAKGTEFLVVQEGDRIVLVKANAVGRAVLDDLNGWEAASLPALTEVWDHDADDVWNGFRG